MTKKLIKIPVSAGDDIPTLLRTLVEHKEKGELNYYLEIYGNKYYSKDIDYDKAFKEIIGCTPEELERKKEEAALRQRIYEEQKATDAVTNLDYRIAAGKKQIRQEKWSLWEQTVKSFSEPPYYTSEIDTIIKYLEMLNTDTTTELIATSFKEQFPETGDWYTSTLLSNIAKFHPRGIELFENLREKHRSSGHQVADSSEYLNRLRNINILLDMGENINDATTIANNRIATITISGLEHLVLVSDNKNVMGVKDDYMIVGEMLDEQNHILYIIDGEKVNSYLTVDGETTEIYIDGRLGDVTNNRVQVSYMDASIMDISEEYYVAYNAYTKLDVPTLLRVLKEIRELTQESVKSPGKLVLHDELKRYKSQVITLKKSTK